MTIWDAYRKFEHHLADREVGNEHDKTQRAWTYMTRMGVVYEATSALFRGIRSIVEAQDDRAWTHARIYFREFNAFWFDVPLSRTVNPPSPESADRIIAAYEDLKALADGYRAERTVLPFGKERK